MGASPGHRQCLRSSRNFKRNLIGTNYENTNRALEPGNTHDAGAHLAVSGVSARAELKSWPARNRNRLARQERHAGKKEKNQVRKFVSVVARTRTRVVSSNVKQTTSFLTDSDHGLPLHSHLDSPYVFVYSAPHLSSALFQVFMFRHDAVLSLNSICRL